MGEHTQERSLALGAKHASRLSQLILGTDADMRRRIGLFLVGSALYPVNAALSWWAIQSGYMLAAPGRILIAYILVGPLTFYVVMRQSASLRFKDPSMVMAQSLFCVGAVMMGFASVQLQFRGLVLAILPLVLMFGQFSLRPRQIFTICMSAVAALCVITAVRWFETPDAARHTIDLGQLIYIVGILLATSRIAQVVSRMRYKLERSRVDLAAALERVNELATKDALTGLANRRRMQDLLTDEAQRSHKAIRPLCVALLDIDHFKRVNDAHGHAIGDDVLKRFAGIARDTLRDGDVLARWGGEEFLLLCPGSTAEHAHIALTRIRQQLDACAPLIPGLPELVVTFSAGITLNQADEAIEATLERADQALYRAKAQGRNRTVQSP